MDLRVFILLGTAVLAAEYFEDSDSCNQSVCASVVSKCLLTQSCKCQLKPVCKCCKECYNCLGVLFSECCSCFNLCPQQNNTSNGIKSQSHVQDLDGVPGLFAALTVEPDVSDPWNVFTVPINNDNELMGGKQNSLHFNNNLQTLDTDTSSSNKLHHPGNCTVVYLAQCMSWNKCKESCQSMGANSFRWFHDGCCECVGPDCLNYGVNESRCSHCPEEEDDELSEEEYEYGEGMEPIGYSY